MSFKSYFESTSGINPLMVSMMLRNQLAHPVFDSCYLIVMLSHLHSLVVMSLSIVCWFGVSSSQLKEIFSVISCSCFMWAICPVFILNSASCVFFPSNLPRRAPWYRFSVLFCFLFFSMNCFSFRSTVSILMCVLFFLVFLPSITTNEEMTKVKSGHQLAFYVWRKRDVVNSK